MIQYDIKEETQISCDQEHDEGPEYATKNGLTPKLDKLGCSRLQTTRRPGEDEVYKTCTSKLHGSLPWLHPITKKLNLLWVSIPLAIFALLVFLLRNQNTFQPNQLDGNRASLRSSPWPQQNKFQGLKSSSNEATLESSSRAVADTTTTINGLAVLESGSGLRTKHNRRRTITLGQGTIRDKIGALFGNVINESGSPYEQALQWISSQDPMKLNGFSDNLIQRYTLALFYFQTSQQGPWRSCNPPRMEDNENDTCVYWDLGRDPMNDSKVWTARDDLEIRWLSARHECEWAQVHCELQGEDNDNVTAIDIMGQNLTGTLPSDLKYLQQLQWLTLSFNFLTGTIPSEYGEFSDLAIFECTDNMITGQIPSSLYRLSNLLQLNPAMNMITGTIPTAIGNLTNLHSLFSFGTLLSGPLPSEIGYLENARNLWCYDNQLSGPLPSTIGQLSLLEELKLSRNMIEGPLPSELGRLQNMKEFLFAWNRMGGTTIPEEFWNMESLVWLDLNDDNFSGKLSPNVGELSNLKGFKASRNDFTGGIPTEIGLLDDLILLWVHLNDLSGSVPDEVCKLRLSNQLQYLNADCGNGNLSDAEISCPEGCCTVCCDPRQQCELV